MQMATLATYFGLGQQTHRSLDDVRMNLEVLKYCATVLFLESSLPDIFTANSWVSPNAITRSRSNKKGSPDGMVMNMYTSSSSVKIELPTSFSNQSIDGNHPILSLMTPNTVDIVPDQADSNIARPDPFDLGRMSDEVERELLQLHETYEEESSSESESSTAAESEASNGYAAFLKPDQISTPSIRVSLAPFYRGTQRIQILHKDITLQLRCNHLKVRFGVNRKFVDSAGRPRLNFVVDATPDLCHVLDACDGLAQKQSLDSGSSSEWRPLLTRKAGFWNSPTMRLQIPTVAAGNVARWVTEIYEKESSATPQRLVFSRFDVEELDTLLTPGTFVDAYLSLDPYDYQQNAGIRLVAKKLIVHSD